jgi:ubiquinone/menaquinone biosynthesis C-methylase UbiE
MTEPAHLFANVDRFSDFAETYDDYRPRMPAVLPEILKQLAEVASPTLVVDVGCGTGLSTRPWAQHAQTVIGVEPNNDMRQTAVDRTTAPNVSYRAGFSTQLDLPDDSADIVTISQAFHWMEPAPTLAEMARILRPGGVFAAFDCDWPPVMHWEAERAYRDCIDRTWTINRIQGYASDVKHWAKQEHLAQITASGHFRHVREIVLHSIEQGSAARLVGLALSQGSIATLLRHDASQGQAIIEELRQAAGRALGETERPWYFSYRVRLGIK